MLAGAVYNPLVEIVPNAGLSDHVTRVLDIPVTVAVNCFAPKAVKLTFPGLIDTGTVGATYTTAPPETVGAAMLVAVTRILVFFVIVAGAV